jgi:cytochrome c553
MKRFTYLFNLLLILSVSALFATACDSDDDNTSGTDTSGSTSGDSSGATSGDSSGATSGTDVVDDTSGSTSGDTSGTLSASAYYDGPESAALGAAGNQARCSTCHSNDGSTGFSGNTFKDIAYHTSFKGGDAPTLLDAANACVTGWMGGTALTAADASWLSLEAYMQSISDEAMTTPNPIAPEVLADEAAYEAAYAGGDATAGATAYGTFCAKCHGGGLVVNVVPAYTLETLKAFPIGRIAQKVRTSGPPPSGSADTTDSTPGPMPFFEPSELSEADLKNIIAHIKAQ